MTSKAAYERGMARREATQKAVREEEENNDTAGFRQVIKLLLLPHELVVVRGALRKEGLREARRVLLCILENKPITARAEPDDEGDAP